MTQLIRHGFAALCLSLVVGCGEDVPTAYSDLPMTEDSYVGVMADLVRLQRHPPVARGQIERDRLADSVRLEILERHGVSPSALVEFADIVGYDPAAMQVLAEQIAELADSLEADSIRTEADRTRTSDGASDSDLIEPVVPGRDPGPRFKSPAGVRPRFADPPGPGPDDPADVVTGPDSGRTAPSPPPTVSDSIRPRPDASRRRPGRSRPTADPNSASRRSPEGANGGDLDGF